MLDWENINHRANFGNSPFPNPVVKSQDEWKKILDDNLYHVARLHGTERPFQSDMCTKFEAGIYQCACCDTPLFDSTTKFDSGTGWPSFDQPIENNSISYFTDFSIPDRKRIEVRCNCCDAHLGHVFPDGPAPSNLRYCINAISLRKMDTTLGIATFGGGCFWCIEHIFNSINGVISATSGYAGGNTSSPSYKEVCAGNTNHAEVVQITFDPKLVNYDALLQVFFAIHDPTTLNKQGNDIGTQYRSIIFWHNTQQKKQIDMMINLLAGNFNNAIITEIVKYKEFYTAESYHQAYFTLHPENPYCGTIVKNKVEKFKIKFSHLLKVK